MITPYPYDPYLPTQLPELLSTIRTPRMFCVETGSLLLGIKANNNIWSHHKILNPPYFDEV